MLIQECSSDKFDVKIAFSCEHCPDKDHFVIIPPVATAQSLLLCQHDHTTSLTIEQQYWMKVPNTPENIMSKGDLSLVELKGVADDVQRNRKLEELVDALEVAPLFKSLEGTANVPLRLLQCWCLCMDNGSEAHSHLVHHLKCIGLTNTAYRLYYRYFLVLSDPSTRSRCEHPFQDEEDLVSLDDIVACSHYIDGEISLLAAALDIPDEQLETLKAKYKSTQSLVFQMLKMWMLSGTHTKQELTKVLQAAEFSQAAQSLMTSLETSTAQQKPHLKDLISHVRTIQWYRLGLQLNIHDFILDQIQEDAGRNQDHLTLMFRNWLKVCESPSWQDVVQALKTIGEGNLAATLEQKFCK